MVSSKQMIVFVLPVIFSIVFGSVVMADTLQKPDRELNMWPMTFSGESSHGSDLEIIGLSNQYAISEPIQIQVKINDSSLSCGDLYITIYTSGSADVVTQGGYFNQCVKDGKLFPNNDTFSKIIDTPGSYKIVADIVSTDLTNISTTGTFTVK